VTMRDFLETHNLLTATISAPTLMILPMQPRKTSMLKNLRKNFALPAYR